MLQCLLFSGYREGFMHRAWSTYQTFAVPLALLGPLSVLRPPGGNGDRLPGRPLGEHLPPDTGVHSGTARD